MTPDEAWLDKWKGRTSAPLALVELKQVIQQAVIEEREACAKFVDSIPVNRASVSEIAAAIRARKGGP